MSHKSFLVRCFVFAISFAKQMILSSLAGIPYGHLLVLSNGLRSLSCVNLTGQLKLNQTVLHPNRIASSLKSQLFKCQFSH